MNGFEDCWAYLAQATRCWLFGLEAASVALSRAALELALREVIRRHPNVEPPPDKRGWELTDLIQAAYRLRILDNTLRQMAHEVRLTANGILHGKSMEDLAAGQIS